MKKSQPNFDRFLLSKPSDENPMLMIEARLPQVTTSAALLYKHNATMRKTLKHKIGATASRSPVLHTQRTGQASPHLDRGTPVKSEK